jgi:anti-anti-sigma factor
MAQTFRQIEVERRDQVCCVRVRSSHLTETEVNELVQELYAAGSESGCKKLVWNMGPKGVVCLYSVLLAKLIGLQRKLRDKGCALILCELNPEVRRIFHVCCLDQLFHFTSTVEAAIAARIDDPPGFPPCSKPGCGDVPPQNPQ